MSAKCRACGAEIVWVKTQSGRPMPLDAKSEKRLVRQGRMGERAIMTDTYTSHFATCPDADEYRKPR